MLSGKKCSAARNDRRDKCTLSTYVLWQRTHQTSADRTLTKQKEICIYGKNCNLGGFFSRARLSLVASSAESSIGVPSIQMQHRVIMRRAKIRVWPSAVVVTDSHCVEKHNDIHPFYGVS